jgi:hypothetical protein
MSGQVDLARPGLGLHSLTLHRLTLEGAPLTSLSLLSVVLEPEQGEANPRLVDAYVRGDDLVATYAETANRPVRVQVYWRIDPIEAARNCLLVDLQVSVQTDLLGIPPVVPAASRCPEGEVLRLAGSGRFAPVAIADDAPLGQRPADSPGCWVFRPAEAGYSYAEMIHPADFCYAELQRDGAGNLTLRHHLFDQGDLEKGVILRSRLRGMLLPRENDLEQVLRGYDSLLQAPLPLTT